MFSLLLVMLPVATTASSPLAAAVRRVGLPDLLLPSTCAAPCDTLFAAEVASDCACVCPLERPIYLHTAGSCVNTIEDCERLIQFFDSAPIPVVDLPATGKPLLPRQRLYWKLAGVNSWSNCNITDVFYDGASHRWRSQRDIFQLSADKNTVIFRGNDVDVGEMAGSVVQLRVSCPVQPVDHLCIAFRIVGTSGTPPPITFSSTRWETIVLAIFCILLLLSLLVTLVAWHISWKRKKRRLISHLQMQFFFQYQQQVAQQHNQIRLEEGDLYLHSPPKRKPHFRAEFLEREHLENPPPMAQQFLEELRRWMEGMHSRLRLRRFVPILITIPEVPDENAENFEAPPEPEAESPASSRSVDSGRDSDGSREEAREENEEVEKAIPKIHSPPPPRPPDSPPRPEARHGTKIPVLLGSASPRQRSRRALRGSSVFPGDALRSKSLPRRRITGIPRPTSSQ